MDDENEEEAGNPYKEFINLFGVKRNVAEGLFWLLIDFKQSSLWFCWPLNSSIMFGLFEILNELLSLLIFLNSL